MFSIQLAPRQFVVVDELCHLSHDFRATRTNSPDRFRATSFVNVWQWFFYTFHLRWKWKSIERCAEKFPERLCLVDQEENRSRFNISQIIHKSCNHLWLRVVNRFVDGCQILKKNQNTFQQQHQQSSNELIISDFWLTVISISIQYSLTRFDWILDEIARRKKRFNEQWQRTTWVLKFPWAKNVALTSLNLLYFSLQFYRKIFLKIKIK